MPTVTDLIEMPEENNDRDDKRRHKLNTLPVPTTAGFEFVDLDAIIYLEADGAITSIFLELTNGDKLATPGKKTRKITCTKNIGYFEELLKYQPFIRIHHSVIANINKAKKYVRGDNGYLLMAVGDITLHVSRSKRDDLLNFLQPGRKAG